MKIGFFSDLVLTNDIKLSKKLDNIIKQNNFNCANLEAPFIKSKNSKIKKGINLYNKTNKLDFLKKYKFEVVNLANNHIFDFGIEGFENTKKKLSNNNIKYFGAGLNNKESFKPVIINKGNKKIGFFGFAWDFTDAINSSDKNFGTASVYINNIKKTLKQFSYLDYKIIYFHFGTEFEDYPEPYQKYMVDKLIELDLVDIIIGNHPHCIQGYEDRKIKNKRKLIFYSLGNFILPEVKYDNKKLDFPQKSNLGFFVNIDFENNLDYEIVPYKLINNSTEAIELSNKEKNMFLNEIKEISCPLKFSYHKYRKFYKKNRNRKFRPVMTKNQKINILKKNIYKFFESNIVNVSKKIGLYKLLRYLYRKLENIV